MFTDLTLNCLKKVHILSMYTCFFFQGLIQSYKCGEPTTIMTLADFHYGDVMSVGGLGFGSDCCVVRLCDNENLDLKNSLLDSIINNLGKNFNILFTTKTMKIFCVR